MTPIHRFALLMTVLLVVASATPVVGHPGSGTTHERSPTAASGQPTDTVSPALDRLPAADMERSVTTSTAFARSTVPARDSRLERGRLAAENTAFDAGARRSPTPLRLSDRPLSFVENRGQFDDDVGYVVDGSGRRVSFTTDGVVFAGRDSGTVTMRFVDGDGSRIDGLARTSGVMNYYRGSDPDGWHTAVPTYSR